MKAFRRSIIVTTSKAAHPRVWIGAKGTDDEERADKVIAEEIQKALKAGHEVTLQDGRKQWIESLLVIDTEKSGSDAYTWNKSGDKVLHERVLFTLNTDNTLSKEVIGKSYRNPFS
tara:strand:- start:225 stop:572 length:348 start_codon:yes stop_codon:yes gene_type:complete